MSCENITYSEYLLKRSYLNDPFKSYKFISHCDIVEQLLGLAPDGNCKENVYKHFCSNHAAVIEALNCLT
ncbi:MAG: hypothetical protein EBU90_25730 [Proteobacteria bacterium]|nr:hypothetical protein [Pseudomonadota bacterium]NBP16555.1 hypothetical protein [bacterium]